ncbi:hypothetical protein L9F63_013125, partial [Diploptera punctata]
MYRHCIFQTWKILRLSSSIQLSTTCKPSQQIRYLHLHDILKKDIIAVSDGTKPGFIKRLVKRMGWLDHSKGRLKGSGYILYENVADKINYIKFFEEFKMPDTFFSWFLITELHVWILMVRTMAEGDEGRFTRNNIVEAMWQDVYTRAKKLEPANPSAVRENLQEISEQFQAAVVGYDEGLLLDDKVLAGALWRRFFQRNCNDPEYLERLVHYIRKQ